MNLKVLHTVDPVMKQVLVTAENVASSRASVLIQGESGTGKELLARYIHGKSNRGSKAFVAINCAAVPDGLLESELFGYEKGAFTGADKRTLGKFEQADEGTFLLDEISELPLILQAKLLRVIQEREVQRLGAQGTRSINVRLIATTNKSLLKMVEMGQFREDLFYRLNVIPLTVPALRSRPKDIDLLSNLFVDISCAENGIEEKKLTEAALKKLRGWRWPGNVRELQNVIERTVLLSSGTDILEQDVQIKSETNPGGDRNLTPGMTVSEAEKLLILKTLEFTGQNRTQAADLLGISIRTLRNKINEYKRV